MQRFPTPPSTPRRPTRPSRPSPTPAPDSGSAIFHATRRGPAALLCDASDRARAHARGRVWRTYVNGVHLSDGETRVAMVPVYTDATEHEEEALTLYAEHMPGFVIVPIDSTELITWGGAIHCITEQAPIGAREPLGEASDDPGGLYPRECPAPPAGESESE
ncbi:MAG: agmatine deiminase family protein, partial [Myxococcota bacterium]